MPAAGVHLGELGAQLFGTAEEPYVRGVRLPGAPAAERAEPEEGAPVAEHHSDPVAPGVMDSRPDIGATALRHLASPFVMAVANAWATGAEQTPRWTRAYRTSPA